MKKLLIFLKDYKKESILGPLFKLLEASFELAVPLVVAAIVDVGIEQNNQRYILSCGFLLAALGLLGLLCSVTAQFFAATAAVGFGCGLRKELFARIQDLSPAAGDRIGPAALMTRITSDVNQVQSGVNMVLRLFLRSPFIVFGAMIMAFTVDRPAAVIFVILIPLLSVMVAVIVLAGIKLFRKLQTKLERVMRITRENLTGVRVIRAFRREEAEKQQFSEESDRLLRLQLLAGRITGLLNPLTFLTVNIGIIALIYTGALRVQAGIITQGAVIALVNYMSQILVELVKMANLIIIVARGFASGGRIAAVLSMADAQSAATMPDLQRVSGSASDQPFIAFRQVSFRYPEAGEAALSGINFTVNRGETIGVIGGTGAGKSTLVHLLPRFYEPTGGTILVDGTDLKSLAPAVIRARIGIVMQKAVLFKGTIRDNILMGREEASDEEVWAALRLAQAEGFVREKEGRLAAGVAQEGRNFSGGQRQRLAIARALVRKPEILILDDSASALDYLTESALRKALGESKGKTTTFIVSQRTSSVWHADKILVLDDGRAAGWGSHGELLENCPVYREIYESQFGREGEADNGRPITEAGNSGMRWVN